MKNSNLKENNKEDKKQNNWETWFILSFFIFAACFFIGTLENSKVTYPNWPIAMILAILNLLICIFYGCKPSKK